jgi:hypothetical protein
MHEKRNKAVGFQRTDRGLAAGAPSPSAWPSHREKEMLSPRSWKHEGFFKRLQKWLPAQGEQKAKPD